MKIYDCFSYWDEDFLLDLRLNILNDYVDYFVVNVSSPNTPGLRELQSKEFLNDLFLSLIHI